MYTQASDANGGWFKSLLSGKTYNFTRDPSNAGRRAALAELEADDRAIRDAQNARARKEIGRDLTEREHLSGNWKPDTRTEREKNRDDAKLSNNLSDPDRNIFSSRIAELEAARALTSDPAALSKIDTRLRMLRPDAQKFDEQIAARKAHEAKMASSEVVTATLYANAWTARLTTDPSVPQEWVDGAKQRAELLKQTGDVEAFYKAHDSFEAERKSVLKHRAETLAAEAAAVQAEADAVRREVRNVPEGGTDAGN